MADVWKHRVSRWFAQATGGNIVFCVGLRRPTCENIVFRIGLRRPTCGNIVFRVGLGKRRATTRIP